MKRALCLGLVLLVVASCAADSDPEVVLSSAEPTTTAPQFSTPLPPGATLAAMIMSRGLLRVGVRYDLEPFGFVTEEGAVAGLGVDLGRELARRWLGDSEAVQFTQVRSDTAVEALQAGEVDVVIAVLTHTMDREAGADFSLPYFVDGQAILVRAADAQTIGGPADLDGRRVAVVAWSDAGDALQAAAPFTLTLATYDRFDAAVGALERGEVDAVADMRRRLFWGKRMLPDTSVVGQYSWAPVAIAFPQNDPFIANLVHLTFQDIVADGTFGGICARWLGPEEAPPVERWPGNAATPTLASAPTSVRVPDTIAALEARGRLVVALVADRSPFAYIDANGALSGFEVDLVRALASMWLGDPAAVDFIPVSESAGKEMVFTGQADMLVGGLAHTRQAELEMDLSQTTYVAGEGLMVHTNQPLNQIQDLQGRLVAVVEGSGSGDVLVSTARAAGISVSVVPYPTLENAIAQLMGGQVSAVAADRALLLGPAYATPELSVLPWRLSQTPLALGLPAGDSAFRDLVNLTLQTMRYDGQFASLYGIWFADAPPDHVDWPGTPYRTLRLAVAGSQGG